MHRNERYESLKDVTVTSQCTQSAR